MSISKKDMGARAAKAAQMAPSIEDRLRHARDLSSSHPADDAPTPLAERIEYSTESIAKSFNASEVVVTSLGARLEMIALDMIDPNPFNARKIYRTSRVSELAASIGAHGQEIPGVATPREGRFVLAAGHYRLRALKLIGAKSMALMIHEGLSDRELYAHSYRENAEREAQSALDNALSWRELLDQGVYASETEIAEVTGMSLPNVNKTIAALRLSPNVLDFIKEDPKTFALSVLYELALYEAVVGETRALTMAKLVADGEAGRKEIQEARALNKTLADLCLSSKILEVIESAPKAFEISVLKDLKRYEEVAGPVDALDIAMLVARGEAGRREIQEALDQITSPRERKRKETSRQYKIHREDQQIGSIKEWDSSGKVTFEVVLTDAKDRAILIAELRKRFGVKD
ncbi:ParB/RepB/Spo0J family partition protein [Glaciimonas sp. Gout2]|uniref:ParB/RepB/Spo0J family partition protein n=2 Tax=Bacteria TaxID=2 RepID=UPI002B227591|nr:MULTISPECIES: ParB/RepB/Spo0J family partition protein [unclassified Glaciimonas]MEB0014354.1 ParB/RepB/Spo0J family partition protein [Glaciimonas sp. Cout2]MEB0084223.1 ParB/RepB/Spo0J family partition protein [Glaciimonas sp. Gout2]